jgi:hypothetical protein
VDFFTTEKQRMQRKLKGKKYKFDKKMRTVENKGMDKEEIKQVGTIILIGIAIWFFWGKAKTDIYRPIYYPDENNLTQYIRGPEFSSLDEAREWIYQQNETRQDKNWDYEIGKNCKPSKYGDIEVCEETLE